MVRIQQRYPHDPSRSILGDCYSACIASILELPIEQVPCAHEAGLSVDDHERFAELFRNWFKERNMAELSFGFHEPVGDNLLVHHVITGPSPRFHDLHHSVVGLGGKVVFDPHPDDAGLAGDPEKDWYFTYFVMR